MTDRRAILAHTEVVVVKVGTSSITGGGNAVYQGFMDSVADQVKCLRDAGKKVLIVSSGAIGVGLAAMNAKPKPKEVPIRQAAASVGQGILMQRWNDSFQRHNIIVSQILLTYDFYSDRERYLNLRNAIQTLLSYDVVPIINENDVICVKEIDAMFGDNDTLSAYVCSKMDADLLIIISDVDGLYERNPKVHPDARIIPVVEDPRAVMGMAGDTVSNVGTGGMRTKLKAAMICHDAGCHMIIISCNEKDGIVRAVKGEDIGTIFLPGIKERKKSRWIKAAHAKGTLVVDSGAANALKRGNVSLLAVGIIDVLGRFNRGDIVNIQCEDVIIAKGMPDYDSNEVSKIRGVHSDRIEEILGHKSYDDVIRSQNIVILDN